ncbi:MAG: NAD-dependent epimerase/dehydratase family protein [Geminicoccaceae bacterium]|jgi:nucleoside-diphosphate-sugar epimerase|nr:NAD-dependent epimerase/dehydratase family protein [Geminicoccaceae bacterium]HRY23523.1 NAD-dependent epimerase/dehydratase family protein [Geminicoccaceae bacterium]
MTRTVALTGATGFVGRHLVARLGQAGVGVRALSRRGPIEGAVTVAGDLADRAALDELVRGAWRVLHLAGVIKTPRPAEFTAVNVEGTRHVAEATAQAGLKLTLVSSLAARHPEVSAYAASKRAAEETARAVMPEGDLTIVRPPAVWGPGDRATLVVFRQLLAGWLVVPAPKGARFSLLHVADLVGLLVDHVLDRLALPPLAEPDDGTPGGYGWDELARTAERLTGRRVRLLRPPTGLLAGPARLADLIARATGADLPLSADKLGELAHADWVAAGPALPWRASRITFDQGFAATVDWYRAAGWLPATATRTADGSKA